MSAITPSDYTAMLTNLPRVYNVQDLKEFLEVNGRPDGVRCEVVKINMTYRCSQLVAAQRRLEKLKEKLAKAEKLQIQPLQPPVPCLYRVRDSVEDYKSQILQVEEQIVALETDRSEGTGVAFVTFIQDEGEIYIEAKSVIKYLDRPEVSGTWEIIRHVCCPSRSEITKNVFCGQKIATKRAPEPSDINWENIGVPKKTIYLRRACTWLATLVVLGTSLLAIFFSSNVKSLLRKVYGPASVSIEDTIAYNVLSFLPSILVVIINLVLVFIIKVTSRMEKHSTQTSYNTSVALKQTIAMFLNTAVVSFIIHWEDFYSPKGLAAEMYNIMISNAVVQPVVYWINPAYRVQQFIRWRAVKKGDMALLSQSEAQKLFEGPELDMPQRYATLMKTYLLTVVYAPMMPFSFLFGLLALCIQYWVDKYMLLRVHARPVRLSHDLDEIMIQVIPVGAMLYACANWIFFVDFDGDFYVPGMVGVVTTIACYLLPVKKIRKIVGLKRSSKVKASVNTLSESEKKYEDAAVDFVDDYDRLNPLTKDQGNQYWVDLIYKKRGQEEAQHLEEALKDGAATKKLNFAMQKKSLLGKGIAGLFGQQTGRPVTAVAPENDPDVSLEAPLDPILNLMKLKKPASRVSS